VFKSINNNRINKRDVCFNDFNRINSFNILRFYYKKEYFYKNKNNKRGYYIRL